MMGVEEFDARDRALVWRTFGGKHRFLLGEADRFVADDLAAFRAAAIEAAGRAAALVAGRTRGRTRAVA
ncbi:MAG: hypothetical protein MZV65_19180 [Chromatiales bacterium]|nr:hypothetical protein [Chromatiales bacterium]